jgi:hypothetical protein
LTKQQLQQIEFSENRFLKAGYRRTDKKRKNADVRQNLKIFNTEASRHRQTGDLITLPFTFFKLKWTRNAFISNRITTVVQEIAKKTDLETCFPPPNTF